SGGGRTGIPSSGAALRRGPGSCRSVIAGRLRPARHSMDDLTVLQRVYRERVVLLGWGAAILMQLAHPQVAAGVAQHSRFLDTPMARFQRLSRTIKVMQALNFGNPDEKIGRA